MENEKYQCISFDGAYNIGDKMIVSSLTFNGMLQVNKCDGKAKYLKCFESEPLFQKGLHHKVYQHGTKYIFAPDNARGIHVYDIEQKKMRFYELCDKNDKRFRCIDSFINEDKLWLFFAYWEKTIVIFDLNNFSIRYLDVVAEKLPQEFKEREGALFWSQLEKKGDFVYGVFWGTPYFMKLNTSTEEVQIEKLDDIDRQLCTVAYDGEAFWFTQLHSVKILKWEELKKKVTEYAPIGAIQEAPLVYNNIISVKEKILVVPNEADEIMYFNSKEGVFQTFCKLPEGFAKMSDERRRWRRFYSYEILDDIVRLYPANANMMVDVDVVNRITTGLSVVLDVENDEEYFKQIICSKVENAYKKSVIVKTNDFGLQDYLKYLVIKT